MRPKPAAKTHLPARSFRILLILGSIALCWIGLCDAPSAVHEQVEIAAQVGDLLAGVLAAAVGVEDDLAGQLAP